MYWPRPFGWRGCINVEGNYIPERGFASDHALALRKHGAADCGAAIAKGVAEAWVSNRSVRKDARGGSGIGSICCTGGRSGFRSDFPPKRAILKRHDDDDEYALIVASGFKNRNLTCTVSHSRSQNGNSGYGTPIIRGGSITGERYQALTRSNRTSN
jgi:hypothetical protein